MSDYEPLTQLTEYDIATAEKLVAMKLAACPAGRDGVLRWEYNGKRISVYREKNVRIEFEQEKLAEAPAEDDDDDYAAEADESIRMRIQRWKPAEPSTMNPERIFSPPDPSTAEMIESLTKNIEAQVGWQCRHCHAVINDPDESTCPKCGWAR